MKILEGMINSLILKTNQFTLYWYYKEKIEVNNLGGSERIMALSISLDQLDTSVGSQMKRQNYRNGSSKKANRQTLVQFSPSN